MGRVSPDFRDLLSEFNAHGVEYLIVGAYAMAAHGRVRATGDLDVWVRPEAANAKRVIAALASFGAPLSDLQEIDLVHAGTVFQIGVAPLRIDVLTGIDGVEFGEAWAERLTATFAGQSVPVLSAGHLVRNKRAVGRTQDLADLEWLEKSGKS
ncbi:MAG: hypothetical protein ACREMA_15245 [Longimicrobiales bacterium]